jgi:hypothetical protein
MAANRAGAAHQIQRTAVWAWCWGKELGAGWLHTAHRLALVLITGAWGFDLCTTWHWHWRHSDLRHRRKGRSARCFL